ncbi:hypothetical protein [Halonatronum saccharophilum]|uniref:hypothetical protein n=1 Tax=Halonatronum saccharophilum TaxID=150060 RepID=UPI0004B34B34|nr:hypothetical protein [Halonatronum saccharophilum]
MDKGSNLVFDQDDLKRKLGEVKTLSTMVNEGVWNEVRKLAFLYEIKISKLLDLIIL